MKSNVKLNVIIEDERWLENVDFDAVKVAEELKDLLFDYVEKVIGKGQHDILSVAKGLSLNVCLSDNNAVCRLNRDFRGIDKPTNVLSFANIDEEGFLESLVNSSETELGDIILAFETVQQEALQKDISVYAHYCHLLVHGFLHILGYDHQDDEEAEEMESLETEVLSLFSISDPYQEA